MNYKKKHQLNKEQKCNFYYIISCQRKAGVVALNEKIEL